MRWNQTLCDASPCFVALYRAACPHPRAIYDLAGNDADGVGSLNE